MPAVIGKLSKSVSLQFGKMQPTMRNFSYQRHLSATFVGKCEKAVTRVVLAGFPRLLESPGFFLENSRTWKVLENHFGSGKSWKLKLKVPESPGKISLKVMHFSSGSNGKQAAIV